MENSIEEDIEIIESIIEEYENCSVPEIDMQVNVTFREKQNNALNHILSDYKRVLKENDELKKSKITYERVKNIQIENKEIVNKKYISKQKIKDKIEEINKMIAYEHNNAVIIQLGKQKRVLQKLLESEE